MARRAARGAVRVRVRGQGDVADGNGCGSGEPGDREDEAPGGVAESRQSAQMRSGRPGRAQCPYGDAVGAHGERLAQPLLHRAFGLVGRTGTWCAGSHIRPSRIFSSASRARLAFDFTAPLLMPRVVAISASLRSAQ